MLREFLLWVQGNATVNAVIDWIESTWLSNLVLDEAGWLWPVSESLHFMALTVMFGTVAVFDLRLLGIGKAVPPAQVHRLVPFGFAGFAVLFLTGILFLSATPDQYIINPAFHFKVILLLISGINLVFFYRVIYPAVLPLGAGEDAPRKAKVCAVISLTAMVGIMCCGRMLTFYRPPYY